ncbi:hypothetical protein [Sporomusa aerivorans]|uniref:hypothetical protein n=1 Tax=Sporomusa aerivorans TaxID=204936 RepID=UPI00352AC272
MQESKTPPVRQAKPVPPVPPSTPGFSFLNELYNLFVRKAVSKEREADSLLHPQSSEAVNISDSLDTGKLTKFIRYIRTGIPPL